MVVIKELNGKLISLVNGCPVAASRLTIISMVFDHRSISVFPGPLLPLTFSTLFQESPTTIPSSGAPLPSSKVMKMVCIPLAQPLLSANGNKRHEAMRKSTTGAGVSVGAGVNVGGGGVAVAKGVGVGSMVGVGVAVAVGLGVRVAVEVGLGVTVAVAVWVAEAVAVESAVAVGGNGVAAGPQADTAAAISSNKSVR